MLQNYNWLALGGIAAVVATCWRQVINVWEYLRGLVIVRVAVTDSTVRWVTFLYLMHHHRRVCMSSRRAIEGKYGRLKSTERLEFMMQEVLPRYRYLFFIKRWPLLFGAEGGGGNTSLASNAPSSSGDSGHLEFIRGTVDIDAILAKAVEWNRVQSKLRDSSNSHRVGRFSVTTFTGQMYMRKTAAETANDVYGYSRGVPAQPTTTTELPPIDERIKMTAVRMFHDTSDDLGFANTKGRINLMALSPTVLEFVEECRRWYTSEKWFLERDIPWRLSVLLWSKPGLGKTTLLKAIAEMLDMPMYVFDLAMMSNVEFGEMWQRAASNAPCMIVFEDFDGVFKGRENVLGREGGGLTFDAVLNTLDGAGSVNGVLLGITTNHPESIDPAMGVASHDGMSSRPGRLDRIIEMPALDADGRLKIAKRILSDYPDMWDTTVAEGSIDSGAQFQDRCVRIAHTRFWSEKI